MSKEPVVIDLYWNEKLNGGRIEDVVQFIDNTRYYWNCYNCGNTYYLSVMGFLTRMNARKISQFSLKCNHCVKSRNLSEDFINSLIPTMNPELKEVVINTYNKESREQEYVTVCPICGRYHAVKLRSIKRNGFFVCKNCTKKYGGYSLDNYDSIKERFPGMEKYWGNNRFNYYETIPLVYSHPFNLVCPRCGKLHTKSLEAMNRSGFYCEQCANHRSRIRNVGSLRDNYEEIADMWDRGRNDIPSSDVLPSSTSKGTFVCMRTGVPHKFESIVYAVVESAKNGGNGCPVCLNRKVSSGYNDFKTLFPEAVKYWVYDKNDNPPELSVCTQETKFWLKCPRCGKVHSKLTDAVERNGAYCEQCARVLSVIKSTSSFKEDYPEAAKMWDEGGNDIPSELLTSGSELVGNFLCTDGKYKKPHIFKKSVASMVAAKRKGLRGCPICAGFEVATGVNDFETICPNISKLWDYNKNDKKPSDVYCLSEDKYYFVCPEGHGFYKDLNHMARSEKIGATGCPVCKGKEVRPGVNDIVTTHKHMMQYWDYSINELDPTTVSAGSNKIVKAHCRFCGDIYETSVFNWLNGLVVACPNCRKRQYSAAEKELCEEIRSWGIDVEENVHLTGDSRTYDMYIPSKKIAIEYNGLYYHSDAIRPDTDYHFKKCSDCLELGIELIQIWEDDYNTKRDIVLRLLKSKLGVSDLRKVNARDCSAFIPQKDEIKPFLEENHIQGYVSGSKYIGLYTKEDELVALMVLEWHKDTNELLIKRYVTSCNVRGGFSKILSLLKDEYPEATGVYTFSDNTISFGDLYKSNGFRSVAFIEPDYSYLVNNVRVHKFNYRKSRFASDPNLYYEEGMTEAELAYANGIPRVYDAGKIRWYKELK